MRYGRTERQMNKRKEEGKIERRQLRMTERRTERHD